MAAHGRREESRTQDTLRGTRGHLRAIEDAGLVHVVPDVQVLGAALEAIEAEEASPPVPAGWVQAVHPG